MFIGSTKFRSLPTTGVHTSSNKRIMAQRTGEPGRQGFNYLR